MKKIITIITLATFILASCGKTEVVEKEEIIKKYAETQVLVEKNFTEELKLIWKIASSQETAVSSQISGQIKQVNYKVWDKVKEGDILAIIDTKTNMLSTNLNTASNAYNNTVNIFDLTKESIQKDLESAKVQLENAKTTRDNTYASTEEQLKMAQTQLDNINTQNKNTKETTNSSLDLSQKSLDTAKLNLENFEKNYSETINWFETKKQNLLKNIDTSIVSSTSNIDSVLTYADTILWVTEWNKNLNNNYEIYLWAKDSSTKSQAENDFREAKTLYDNLLNSNSLNLDKLSELEKLTNKTILLYEDLVKVADNSITSSSFTDTTLATMKTTIKTNQSIVLWIKSWIVSFQNSWDDLIATISSTKTTLDTNKISLNQALIIAETSLQNTINSTNSNLDNVTWNKTLLENQLQSTLATIKSTRDSVDNAVKIAENSYNSTKAKLESSLAWVKSQLDSATGQKNSLLQQLDNTSIKAPYSWVITAKNIEVWTLVNPGTPVFSISNEKSKIVKLDLNSDNIKFIKIWQEVLISKSWLEASWSVSLVSSSADSITKMYKIEVTFDNSKLDNVVLWDYTDVYLKKQSQDNKKFIIIPFTSLITSSSWDFSVFIVWSWSVIIAKNIKIWDSNSHEIVVTDWLKVWDKIVTEWTLNLSEGDVIEE